MSKATQSQRTMLKYGQEWRGDADPLALELECVKRLGKWQFRSRRCGMGLPYHVKQACRLLWPDRYWHEWSELLLEGFLSKPGRCGVFGPSSCVPGETQLFDPLTGKPTPIKYLCENRIAPVVMTINGPRQAEVPFVKGVADIYEITTVSGVKFRATAEHRVMTSLGVYATVASLLPGAPLLRYEVFPPQTNTDTGLSTHASDAPHLRRTVPDSQCDYLRDCHCDDAQLLKVTNNVQDTVPSQVYVPAHNSYAYVYKDDLALAHSDNHSCLAFDHPSNCNAFPVSEPLEIHDARHFVLKTGAPVSARSRFYALYQKETPQDQPPFSESTRDSAHTCYPDEVLTLDTPYGGNIKVHADVVSTIRWTGIETFYDLHVPIENHYFAEGAIHHNSQKSFHLMMFALVMFYARPKGTTVLVSSTTLDDLQRRIWGYTTELDREARLNYPDLPGHFIESKLMLLADAKEVEGRSRKDGIIGVACRKSGQWEGLQAYVGTKNEVLLLVCDECFVEGTLVDTPDGRKPIETIKPGDTVYNAIGVGTVQAVSIRMPTRLVQLYLKSGTPITVTPNHPFLTQKGWIRARDLNQSHFILTAHEAMRIVRQPEDETSEPFLRKLLCEEIVVPATQSSIQTKPEEAKAYLRLLWDTERARDVEQVLQRKLRNSLRGTWVDRVEILQPNDPRTETNGGSKYLVYNLQVNGHPSYSVNGLLVHNCHFMPVGFLDALANLESNDPCYAALMGNLPDVENPLGWACEPKAGWEGLPDTEISRIYETKWVNGRAVQLVGLDSPNLKFPEGQEPYKGLIGRRYIEQCAINYGRDSTKYHMFASGKVPQAGMHCTVFTKQECIKHEASASVMWGHDKVVRGYGMDAAYSGLGGDRTVGFPFVFGKDVQGKWRFWLGPMHIYPGSRDPKVTHAEAIAQECKKQCEAAGIPPEHVFFDGTGRSELTSAFARLWSSEVVPIEFGGSASDRPAFTGEMWRANEKKEKPAGTLKKCSEVFDRFVTELWFALKWCIVADQMRGMPQEAIDEGSLRKFHLVRGGREAVETKEEMKDRGLRSADICDAIVSALEGARRLGFPLGRHTTKEKKQNPSGWLNMLKEQSRERSVKGLVAV